MSWYYILSIVVVSFGILGAIFRSIIYIVRKNDKVAKVAPMSEQNTDDIRRLRSDVNEAKRQIEELWGANDKRKNDYIQILEEIKETRRESERTNDIILKALSSIAEHSSDFATMKFINDNTIRKAAGRS